MPRALRWLFEDRSTGRIVVVQWPNIPLSVWIAAAVVGRFLHGGAATVVGVIGSGALAVWAVLEIGWGVNPFRRGVGVVVLVGMAASLLLR